MIEHETAQIREWKGEFGREYTDRNVLDPEGLDQLYLGNYGISRTELNGTFLEAIPADAQVLEVGCNVGNQLLLLQRSGYKNLHGIEIQKYAVDRAHERLPGVDVREGSALQIPYPDKHFDLVFTSGVLIHISPSNLSEVLREIHRTAKTWIWGLEYYADAPTEVMYRGQQGLLWKSAFAQVYLDRFSDLELVRERRLPYLNNSNVDTMFLLRRKA
ncbi:MAG TPA: pseudaminic acid biosynthesis-associated methylase [Terriglobales bacterium]|nr:pseudaminic acid biosynthesis-associated methylase [Terriglobales bacterium]